MKTDSAQQVNKKVRCFFIRLLFSIAVLTAVYSYLGVRPVLDALGNVPLEAFLTLCGLYFVGQLLSAYKWFLLSQGNGSLYGIFRHVHAYFFGMFINTSGLGTVGGDVTRALMVSGGLSKAKAIYSVVLDRIHGLSVLLCIELIALQWIEPLPLQPYGRPLALLSLIGMLAAALTAKHWLPLLQKIPLPTFFRLQVSTSSNSGFFLQPKVLIPASLVSLLFHCIQIYMHQLVLASLGFEVSLIYLAACIPLVNILSSLPLSLHGLGIREALYVALLVPAGVSPATATACGTLWFAIMTCNGLAGGIAVLFDPNQRHRAVSQKPLPRILRTSPTELHT